MISRILLLCCLLLASVGYAGGQSTVIGKRADLIITLYAYLNKGEVSTWPRGLAKRVDYRLFEDNESRSTFSYQIDARMRHLLAELSSAMKRNDWVLAFEIREYIQWLIDRDDDDNDDDHNGCLK